MALMPQWIVSIVLLSLLLLLSAPENTSAIVLPISFPESEQHVFQHSSSSSPCHNHNSTAMTKPFPELKNDLILRAARGEDIERVPVWIMRQAGRYLPGETPELATKVTIQPIDRYDGLLDAAIIFSDILVVPQALGIEVKMDPAKGPILPNPIVDPQDMRDRLKKKVNVHKDLQYVFDAITMTRHALEGRVPLIGFVGGPWTLMAYMIEGNGNRMLSKAKGWLYEYPEESMELLQRITDVIVDFLVGQVHAGAQMLQVFESFSGDLGPRDFDLFTLPYLTQIVKRVKSELGSGAVPMTIFAKGSWYSLNALSSIGYDVVSLDWTVDPEDALEISAGRVTLQGNLEPFVLLGSDVVIRAETEKMIRRFGPSSRYIANLGHGIPSNVRLEAVEMFLKIVHRAGRRTPEEMEEEWY
ncbi:Uroporphyrinogen decarboxylase in heme biosynthesis [Entomortierella lignicola]|nr:Uroporphyrinogen decarboxylase in heme biosynthesis [Entomortierella lignicola]